MDVSIIIINYKTFKLTSQCIDSILSFTTNVSFEIILVENGTEEFTVENTSHWGNKIKLIVSEENLGFAGGNNLGIKNAEGKYILLLNSDTYLVEDSITKIFHFLESQPQIGVASPKLIYPDGRRQSVAQRFPSLKYGLIELFRIQKFFNRRKSGKLLLGSFFDHNETTEVDWVWGAFFMFPRSILSQLPNQKLDDTYFMYWEDVQWCMDIKKLGYKIYYFAETQVVHVHEGSKVNKNEMMVKSGQLFFQKNYSFLEAFAIKKINKWLET
jgi:GT2 family glycosyltransferase